MSSDGKLPEKIPNGIPEAHWVRVESGALASGTPDLNGCLGGREVWVECKATIGWKVSTIRRAQIGWMERRERAGGRCVIAVRQVGPGRNTLWLLRASAGRSLLDKTALTALLPDYVLAAIPGSSEKWDWELVRKILFEI